MKCRLCRSDIQDGARVCPVCKLNQCRMWNALPYIGGIGTVLTAIACAAVFIMPKLDDWYAINYGAAKLQLISASSAGELSFLNSGSRDLYIRCVVFEGHDPCRKEIIPVNERIRHGEFWVGDSPDKPELERDYKPLRNEYVQLFLQCSPTIPEGSTEDKARVNKWLDQCHYVWYTEKHVELEAIQTFIARYGLLNGTAKVECFTGSDYKPLTISVPCQALLVQTRPRDAEFAEPPEDILAEIQNSMPPLPPGHSCTHEDLVLPATRRFVKVWTDTEKKYVTKPALPKPKGGGGEKQFSLPLNEPTLAPAAAPAPVPVRTRTRRTFAPAAVPAPAPAAPAL